LVSSGELEIEIEVVSVDAGRAYSSVEVNLLAVRVLDAHVANQTVIGSTGVTEYRISPLTTS
jgi:hypothetical protein